MTAAAAHSRANRELSQLSSAGRTLSGRRQSVARIRSAWSQPVFAGAANCERRGDPIGADRDSTRKTSYLDISASRSKPVGSSTLALNQKSAPVPPIRFVNARLAHELAYRKRPTPCLRVAQSAGAGCVADGVDVSVEQAAERSSAGAAFAVLPRRLIAPDDAAEHKLRKNDERKRLGQRNHAVIFIRPTRPDASSLRHSGAHLRWRND